LATSVEFIEREAAVAAKKIIVICMWNDEHVEGFLKV
jgi:hypothetical protein